MGKRIVFIIALVFFAVCLLALFACPKPAADKSAGSTSLSEKMNAGQTNDNLDPTATDKDADEKPTSPANDNDGDEEGA